MQQPASAGKTHQNGYMMKRLFLFVLAMGMTLASVAQNSSRFEQRYDLLVSQFGPAGVGIETVLDNWAKVDSTNARMLQGRFTYLFTKAQSPQVEARPVKKYLGMDPVLTLKDSLGNDIFYFQVIAFDDEIYAEAIKAADKAISCWPDRLDFRFMKANAYIAYEKESPDMALSCLMSLIDENKIRMSSWEYEGDKVGQDFFQNAVQEYCFSFYSLGTAGGYEAFRTVSEKMTELFPDNPGFINNIGTYHLIAKNDYKTAYKYYNKVLKEYPDDYTAIKNGVLAARKQGNLKTEKKYLEMMLKYGSEAEKLQARTRLDSMKK